MVGDRPGQHAAEAVGVVGGRLGQLPVVRATVGDDPVARGVVGLDEDRVVAAARVLAAAARRSGHGRSAHGRCGERGYDGHAESGDLLHDVLPP